jgi:hypothetical protein
MANPWPKKNPFMSIWLSSFNALAGKARAAGAAEFGRQRASWLREATRLWTGARPAKAKPKRRRGP